MARHILKIGDQYLEWSSITDSPTCYLMSKQEMIDDLGIEPERMDRADVIGTSSLVGDDLAAALSFNRAGPNEEHLKTVEELVGHYTFTNDKLLMG
jgi:hypothetical protein